MSIDPGVGGQHDDERQIGFGLPGRSAA